MGAPRFVDRFFLEKDSCGWTGISCSTFIYMLTAMCSVAYYRSKEKQRTASVKFDLMTRLPPQNLEAEESILSAILINNSIIKDVLDILTPEDFYRSAHQKIFEAMVIINSRNRPVDLVTTSNYLKAHNRLEEVGGATYLARLIDSAPLAANASEYAQIVHEKAVKRRLIAASNGIARKCFADDDSDVSRLLIESQAAITSVSYRDPTDDSFTTMGKLAETSIDRYEERSNNRDQASGLMTGFHLLDWMIAGFQPSDLIIIAGRPSQGKSSFMMNLSKNFGRDNIPHAIFSLEMSKDQLFDRQISAKTGINLQTFRTGKFVGGDWNKINDAAGELYSLPAYIDDEPDLHYSQIRRRAGKLKERHDIKAVLIDYLQLIRSDSNLNLDREITRISANMKAMAKELEIPVIILSQLNRELEKRQHPHKRPRLSDLRGSGSLEQDPDVIIFIYRHEQYLTEDEKKVYHKMGHAEFDVAKQRNGPTGMVELMWKKKTSSFHNIDTRYE